MDLDRARDLFLRSKPKITALTAATIQKGAVPISEMPDDELQDVLQYLGLAKFEPATFLGVQAFCHSQLKILFFPMLDVAGNIVGYKRLSRPQDAELVESTFPEQNSFGSVIFHPLAKRGTRDHKTAILVVNMLDALALRMEKSNGKCGVEIWKEKSPNLFNCFFKV